MQAADVVTPARWGRSWISAVVLLTLAVLIVIARLHTYDEPLELDLTNYAVVAHEMLAGRKLYSELWDSKPPAIYVTYGAAEQVAGYSPRAVFLLNTIAAMVTLLGIYRAGTAAGMGRAAGLWAAGFWVVVSGDMMLEANQPNTEVFINACLVWAFAALVRMEDSADRWRRPVFIGTLFVLATLYKQVAIATVACVSLAHVLAPAGGGRHRKQAVIQTLVITAVGAATWIAVLLYFMFTGRLTDFLEVNFTSATCNTTSSTFLTMLNPGRLYPDFLVFTISLAVLCVGGLLLGRFSREWKLWLAYAFGTMLAVALPGWFSRHYYQLWLPVLAVGAGWTIGRLGQLPQRLPAWLPHGVGAAALMVLLWHEVPSYALTAEEWSRTKYGEVYIATRKVARQIDTLLAPGETFFNWGIESGLYYYSQRRPPTRLLYNHILCLYSSAPFTQRLADNIVVDLEHTRPELLVLPTLVSPSMRAHPLTPWLVERYQLLPEASADKYFHLCALRGGALAVRLNQKPDMP